MAARTIALAATWSPYNLRARTPSRRIAMAPSTKLVANAASVSPPGNSLSTNLTSIGYVGRTRRGVVDEVRDVGLDVPRIAVSDDAQVPQAIPRRQHVADRPDGRGRRRSPDDVRIAEGAPGIPLT
jgi:hypothetical protein